MNSLKDRLYVMSNNLESVSNCISLLIKHLDLKDIGDLSDLGQFIETYDRLLSASFAYTFDQISGMESVVQYDKNKIESETSL